MNACRFDPDALDEYEHAIAYFEQRREGLGARFIRSIERAVEAAVETPRAGAPWPGILARLGIRRRAVPGFPSIWLAYAPVDQTLYIIAVVHARRSPGYWLARLNRIG